MDLQVALKQNIRFLRVEVEKQVGHGRVADGLGGDASRFSFSQRGAVWLMR